MRILFVHSIGKNKFGGGERWLITVAAGLKSIGHTVFVGAKSDSKLQRAATKIGLETVSLNIISDLSIYHAFRIATFLKRNRIDIVITRGRDLAVAGLAARMGGRQVVIVRHGLPLRSSIRKHSFLLNWLADGIITNTYTIKNLYEQKGWVRNDFTKVIYNGTPRVDSVTPYNYSERYPGKTIVLSVGRLAAQKGYFFLIDAIALLSKKYSNLMFVVLGDGKLHSKLVSYAQKKGVSHLIEFEGFVENVIPYLMGCDLFVLSSLYEGMSNAAMEAMACGKPVIITKVNGAEELIPDEGKGILIPPSDSSAIAQAVERLVNDSKLRGQMGEEARRYVLENFTVSSMVEQIEQYIEGMVKARARV